MRMGLLALAATVGWLPLLPRPAVPTPVQQATNHRQNVLIREADIRQIPGGPLYMAGALTLPPADPALPVVSPEADLPGATLLRSLVARGVSQGFGGLLYENRDRDHSPIRRHLFPNLGHIVYGPTLQKTRWDYGLANRIVIPGPLIGNSSTALTAGAMQRSQMRFAMTSGYGPQSAFAQYAANSLYVYPEHNDHDSADLYPANWPYSVNSQGSSGSDQRFMAALLMALAAFPADTRAALEREGLIAPTLQMILRRNLQPVNGMAEYLTARAHPTAIDPEQLRPARMIAQAAAMKPDQIPPMVRLGVVRDPFLISAGLVGRSEHLFTTPSAIARIWRTHDWQREIELSAEATRDPNGRPLIFHWVVLRGDPERVRITPVDEAGTGARISVAWHDAYPAPPRRPGQGPPRMTSRVDIGVFADNGVHISAPAFVSISFPTHQRRVYAPGPEGVMRLMSVDYDAATRSTSYDPLLHWTAPWRDEFRYDPSGYFLGWTRFGKTGWTQNFRSDGRRADGRAIVYELPQQLSRNMVLSYRSVRE